MTFKAFILSLMEHCSPLWAGAPASHLALLDAMENKVLKIIGISHDEPECLDLLLSISVVFLYSTTSFLVLHPLPSLGSVPPRFLHSTHHLPVTLFLLNSQNPGSRGTNFPSLFSPIIHSRSSRQLFTMTSDHPLPDS